MKITPRSGVPVAGRGEGWVHSVAVGTASRTNVAMQRKSVVIRGGNHSHSAQIPEHWLVFSEDGALRYSELYEVLLLGDSSSPLCWGEP